MKKMGKLEELRKQKQEIEAQIKDAEDEEQREREENVIKKIEAITLDKKEAILSIMEHDRTSCSDENPCNGWYSSYYDGYRCRKCMLMEILNGEHGGRFDFNISVDINEV